MHPTSRPRPAQPSLLGTYPVPELHLVGAPVPHNPRSPSQWQPAPPPLQYGIDYTFTHRIGREPVRWQPDSSITVRIAGTDSEDRRAALTGVVAELRALTRLDLVTGEPRSARLVPSSIPAGEIHVGYLAARTLSGPPARHGGQAGLGAAARCDAGCCYLRGFVIVNVDLTGLDAAAEHALAILRHELAHALGLGHAARPSLLMHHQLTADTTRYGRGDQHGLALLGSCSSAGPGVPGGHAHQSAATCGIPPQRQVTTPRLTNPEISSRANQRHLAWCFAPAS